ncbi:MAG: glycoside hydrolase family 15 protein, partial [Bacteroidota bacterium]
GMLRKTGEAIIDRWHEPDEGIWEIRAEPRQHTYSKLMCWAALDRLARLHDHGDIIIPKERFQREANRIREVVLTEGYNRDLGAFVSVLGGDKMDASLLLMAEFGFLDPNDPRMIRTHELILEKLGDGVLLRRYEPHADDGLPGEEGAFGICSFWDDEYLARRGLAEEAVHRFETMLGYANDLGLYAEQLDPETGAHLGNFPQAFTHIGLINTLLVIAHETGERPAPEVKDKFTSESEENGRIA